MCVCFGKCLGLCRFKMREFPPVCEAFGKDLMVHPIDCPVQCVLAHFAAECD